MVRFMLKVSKEEEKWEIDNEYGMMGGSNESNDNVTIDFFYNNNNK